MSSKPKGLRWAQITGPHTSPQAGVESKYNLVWRCPLFFLNRVAAAAKSLQSCPTLCDPIDGSPPGSPVPGILQARTPECVAISFSNAGKWKVKVKSLSHVRLSVTPWTPGSSIHGIFQARVLEWVAIAFSQTGQRHTDLKPFKSWRLNCRNGQE